MFGKEKNPRDSPIVLGSPSQSTQELFFTICFLGLIFRLKFLSIIPEIIHILMTYVRIKPTGKSSPMSYHAHYNRSILKA